MKHVAEQLLAIGAVKLSPKEPFTWASGWKSPIYCDNRKALSNVYARNVIVEEMVTTICCNKTLDSADVTVGVATGAIAWGAMVAKDYEGQFAYVRSKAKDHGLGNQIEGVVNRGDKVVVIEDLISTGGSSLAAVQALRAAGAKVVGMVAIFTYGFEKARKAFAEAKCPLYTLTDYNELLEVAEEHRLFDAEEKELLAQWRLSPDTWGK